MNVNSDSGMLNTVSGKEGEVFRLNRNERSHWSGSVHIGPEMVFTLNPELVFMIGRNMHTRRNSAWHRPHDLYFGAPKWGITNRFLSQELDQPVLVVPPPLKLSNFQAVNAH